MYSFVISKDGKVIGVEELRDREIILGRRKPSGPGRIALDDATVSSNHATVTLIGDRYAIRDLGSRNGILINGQAVPAMRDFLLSPGDKVSICDFLLTFSNAPAAQVPRAEAFPASFSIFDLKMIYAPRDVVGGDFFAFRALDDDRLALAVGEALGDGRPMAEITLACRDHVKRLAAVGSPARVVAEFQAAMTGFFTSGRVVLLFGILDGPGADFVYVSAGEICPVLFQRGKTDHVRRVISYGDALSSAPGAAPRASLEEKRLTFSPGESMILCTGGALTASPSYDFTQDEQAKARLFESVSEARSQDLYSMLDRVKREVTDIERKAGMFGIEGIAKTIGLHGGEGIRNLVPALHRALLDHHQGRDPKDDMTVIGVERAR